MESWNSSASPWVRIAASSRRSRSAQGCAPQCLVDTQNEHHDLSTASTHVHLGNDDSFEVAILCGPVEALRRHSDELTAQRGVRHAYLHLIPVPEEGRERSRRGHPPRWGSI